MNDSTTGFGLWWISLSLVNAGLAQSKGRSGWYWWVWSLILGPVATFLIVVWAPRHGTSTPRDG